MWLRIAWRNLLRSTRRTAFGVSICVIGTVAILAMAGYVLATFTAVRESAIRNGVGHLQIATAAEFDGYEERILEHGLTPSDVQAVQRAVAETGEVVLLLPRLEFQGLVSTGERSLVALGEGVDPGGERRLRGYSASVISGVGLESAAPSSSHIAVIGKEMARLLGAEPGDSLTLLATAAGGGINAMDVEIVGVLSTGVAELDRMRLLVPITTAQELQQTHRIRRLIVLLEDTAETDRVAAILADRLPGLTVRRWYELAPFYRQLVALYARQAGVFAAVIGVVVMTVTFSVIAMGVLERRREIGTLLSLGVPAGKVRRLFLLEGLLIAAIGSGVGAIISCGAFAALNSIRLMMPPAPGHTEPYPLIIAFSSPAAVLTVIGMCILALSASWAASRRVTRCRIVDALARG